jgi:hypothetical protein
MYGLANFKFKKHIYICLFQKVGTKNLAQIYYIANT